MTMTTLLRLQLLFVLGFLACRPAVPPSVGEPRSTIYFEDQRFASLVQQAREELVELRRSQGWKRPGHKFLLAPLAGERAPAMASALNWWLLRFEAGLMPQRLDASLRSVAEVQAMSRRESDATSEYWVLDLVGTQPTRFELVVVQDGSVLRSREFSLWNSEPWAEWPLDPAGALARLSNVGARALFREGDRIFVETKDGRAPLSLRGDALRLGRVERSPALVEALSELPELELRRDDVRLIWSQRIDESGECTEGWSLSRLGATLPLPLRRSIASPLLALRGWVTSGGERWLLLRGNGDIELHPVSMRVSQGARSAGRRSPDRKSVV